MMGAPVPKPAVASLPPEQMFELMKQMKVSGEGSYAPCFLCEHLLSQLPVPL